jgi:hypothetical protein
MTISHRVGAEFDLELRGLRIRFDDKRIVADANYLPRAREAPFRKVHSVSRFLSLSNNMGNLVFVRRATPMAVLETISPSTGRKSLPGFFRC